VGGGWVQHGTTVRYSELADPHCLHVSFNPDIWQPAVCIIVAASSCSIHLLHMLFLL
jgi:hypothetical protein